MQDKLEVGMYCRFINFQGKIKIAKIKEIQEADDVFQYDYIKFDDNEGELEPNIKKASHNIIDLIEVGDYVNGYYVEDVLESFINVATGSNYFQSPTIYENDIKSIVTKEQFKSMEYRLGDDK